MNTRAYEDPFRRLAQLRAQRQRIESEIASIERTYDLGPIPIRPDGSERMGHGRSAYCLGASIGTASPKAHERCMGWYGARRGVRCGCSCHGR